MKYPHFCRALRALAPTHEKRAERLGVSVRSIIYYLQGESIPHLRIIEPIPELRRALGLDLLGAPLDEPVKIAA